MSDGLRNVGELDSGCFALSRVWLAEMIAHGFEEIAQERVCVSDYYYFNVRIVVVIVVVVAALWGSTPSALLKGQGWKICCNQPS